MERLKYLELPFGKGILLLCYWVSSLTPPCCAAISKLLFHLIPVIKWYLREMDAPYMDFIGSE